MTRDRGRDPLRAWLRAQRLRQQETLDMDFDIAMALRGGGDQRAQLGFDPRGLLLRMAVLFAAAR